MNRTTRSYPGGRPDAGRARRFLLAPLAVMAGTLALASCSTKFDDDDARDHQTILIKQGAAQPDENQSFSPNPVTVLVRTEVLWVNQDSEAHQIASLGGLFPSASQPIPPGGQYPVLFTDRGSYRYYCLRPGHREEGVINVLP
jgi:plastocyanin